MRNASTWFGYRGVAARNDEDPIRDDWDRLSSVSSSSRTLSIESAPASPQYLDSVESSAPEQSPTTRKHSRDDSDDDSGIRSTRPREQEEHYTSSYAVSEAGSDAIVLESTGTSLAQVIKEKEELEKKVIKQQQQMLDLAQKQIASNDYTLNLQWTVAQLQNTVADLAHTVNGPSELAPVSVKSLAAECAQGLTAEIARAEGKGAMTEIQNIKKFLLRKHTEIERRERDLENLTDHLERRMRIVNDLAKDRFEALDGTTVYLLDAADSILDRLVANDVMHKFQHDMRKEVQNDVDALEARFTAEVGRHKVFENQYRQHVGAIVKVSSEHTSDIGTMRKAINDTRDGLNSGMANMSSRISGMETAVQAERDSTAFQEVKLQEQARRLDTFESRCQDTEVCQNALLNKLSARLDGLEDHLTDSGTLKEQIEAHGERIRKIEDMIENCTWGEQITVVEQEIKTLRSSVGKVEADLAESPQATETILKELEEICEANKADTTTLNERINTLENDLGLEIRDVQDQIDNLSGNDLFYFDKRLCDLEERTDALKPAVAELERHPVREGSPGLVKDWEGVALRVSEMIQKVTCVELDARNNVGELKQQIDELKSRTAAVEMRRSAEASPSDYDDAKLSWSLHMSDVAGSETKSECDNDFEELDESSSQSAQGSRADEPWWGIQRTGYEAPPNSDYHGDDEEARHEDETGSLVEGNTNAGRGLYRAVFGTNAGYPPWL